MLRVARICRLCRDGSFACTAGRGALGAVVSVPYRSCLELRYHFVLSKEQLPVAFRAAVHSAGIPVEIIRFRLVSGGLVKLGVDILVKYILKRVALGLLSVFIVATITFFLMNLVPGGPFVAEKSISKAAQEALAAKYGLDKPLYERYFTYMTDFLKGDMGASLRQRGRTVSDIIFTKFPVSAKLAGIAVAVALLVGIPLGCLAAYNRGKFWDNFILVLATCGIAIPSFITSVVLLYTFGSKLKILPTIGLNDMLSYIMPVTALAIYPTAYITRLMRSGLLDVMGQDYIRTAKAKGLSDFKVLFKHAMRNAILPVVTYVGPMLASLMTGSFVVEKIFAIPGLGREFVSSITNRDYTMIMGTTIVLASLIILANVVVDILYKVIDPRIRLK